MTQRKTRTTMIPLAGAALAIALTSVVAPLQAVPMTQSAIDEATLFAQPATQVTAIAISTSTTLSDAEARDILFMREEEKLAHDVYVTLGEVWETPVFSNIARAETMHTDAVGDLINTYGLDDPISTNPVGVFTDQTLQAMYDDLVATGSESLTTALEVGALIEEVDIEDLINAIDETQATDVALVWDHLLSGSQNHLRAFTAQLNNLGVDYTPTVLDEATYTDMLASATTGSGGGHRGGHGQGGPHGGGHGFNG